MSADRLRFPPLPGGGEGFPAVEAPGSPLSDAETLRVLVSERLAAAVEDILGLFVKTVDRYREQIDLQRREMELLRTEEGTRSRAEDPLQTSQTTSWIKPCPDDPGQLDQADPDPLMDACPSASYIKTEAEGPDYGGHFDPGVCDGAAEVLIQNSSETDDSGDYWRDSAGLWRPEETGAQSVSRSTAVPSDPPESLPVFSCKVCGESFQKTSHLFTHALAHLRDCGLCGKHLEHTENLKLHLRLHRETSFRCVVCGQSFTLRGNLRTHMRIHSGERPFGCSVCGKSFGRRATLVRHVRSHTGEKPFTCSYCGRGFVEKGNLTVHLRTHTGERPYRCSTCDRRFSQLSCYYKHPCQRRGLTEGPAP